MVSTLFLLIISNIHYGDIGHNGRAGGGRRQPLPTQMNSFFVPAACLSRSTSEPLGSMQNWMCGKLLKWRIARSISPYWMLPFFSMFDVLEISCFSDFWWYIKSCQTRLKRFLECCRTFKYSICVGSGSMRPCLTTSGLIQPNKRISCCVVSNRKELNMGALIPNLHRSNI